MKSSEELEREGEDTRACINQTLDELRSRVTPGQVLDELVDYARGTQGGVLVRNLGQQVVENPLPLALIGTGLAWLMATDARARRARRLDLETPDIRSAAGRTADAARDVADSTRSAARDIADSTRAAARDVARSTRSTVRDIGSTMADVRSSVRDTASRSTDAASSVIDSARAAAASKYQRATRATRRATSAIGDSSAAMARSVQDRSMDFVDFCREQPLVVAGLGLALGAALGAALPRTEAEDRLVGDASDDVKERMQRVAGKVKDSATSAYQQVADEARAPKTSGEQAASAADTAGTGAPRATSSQDEGGPRPMSSSADPRMLRPGDECSELPSESERR